jgi:hypothetical protein
MKYLFVSMVLSAGVFLYLSTAAKRSISLSGLSDLKVHPAHAADEDREEEDSDSGTEPDERMVQIHGKWYKYRPDNTYMINGVPTLHIAKIRELKPKPRKEAETGAAQAGDSNVEKSQRLAKMAGENPLNVYTPDGMKALKDGIEAAQKSAAERKKALEAHTKEP